MLNSLADSGAGFGTDTNKVSIIGRDGQERDFALKSKAEVAADVLAAAMAAADKSVKE